MMKWVVFVAFVAVGSAAVVTVYNPYYAKHINYKNDLTITSWSYLPGASKSLEITDMVIDKINETLTEISGHFILHEPFECGTILRQHVHIRNDNLTANIMTTGELFDNLKLKRGGIFNSMAKHMEMPEECPIPAETYEIKGMQFKLSPKNVFRGYLFFQYYFMHPTDRRSLGQIEFQVKIE